MKVFQALPRYNSEYKFSTWIFRIASNAGIDFLRKRRIRTVSMDAPPSEGKKRRRPASSPPIRLDPYATLRNDERRAMIGREIAALPPNSAN